MASEFKRAVQADVLATGQTIYTCPAATQTVIIGFILSNKSEIDQAAVKAVLKIQAGDEIQILGSDTPIPIGSALNALAGKIVLQEGDAIKVTPDADNQIDAVLSLLELT